MNTKRTLTCLVLLLLTGIYTSAQELSYKTSWINNTFNGTPKWVQHAIEGIRITKDGAIFTAEDYEEGGRCTSRYLDGSVNDAPYESGGGCWCWGTAAKALAVNDNFVFVNTCGGSMRKFSHTGKLLSTPFNTGKLMLGMDMRNDTLYGVREDGQVQVWNTLTNIQIRNFQVAGANHEIAVDWNSNLWIMVGKTIKKYSKTGTYLGIAITDLENPGSVSVSHKTGQLIVTENGYNRQVYFYDISGTPTRVKEFGDLGGIASGVPGEIKPDKLFSMVGAEEDQNGNIYVAMYELSVILRKYTPDGAMDWQLLGLNFVDVSDFDRSTDGTMAYGMNEITKLDYSTNTPGKEWSYFAHTCDAVKYPNDPRIVSGENQSAFVRTVNGHKLLFTIGMYANKVNVYYFNYETDGYIAIYSGISLGSGWALWPDSDGNIWEANNLGIYKHPLTGFELSGKPIYGNVIKTGNKPAEFDGLLRILYQPETDVLYLSGTSPGHPEGYWGTTGPTYARYDNWSTTQDLHKGYPLNIPWQHQPNWDQGVAAKGFTVTGDYMFVQYGVKGPDGPITECKVYNANTAQPEGWLAPTALGGTGWIDIPYSIQAYKRNNGEYAVFVEDDWHPKNILYRWCPEGDCKSASLFLTSPSDGSYLQPGSTAVFDITASHEDGIGRVELYANNVKVGETNTQPYQVSWTNVPRGTYNIVLKMFSTGNADTITSSASTIIVDNQRPVTEISNLQEKKVFEINSTINLLATAHDFDGSIDSVQFYHNETYLGSDVTEPYEYEFILTQCGPNNFYSIAFDNIADSALSVNMKIGVILPGIGKGSIYREVWNNTTGLTVLEILKNINYPKLPTNTGYDTVLASPRDVGDNYGVRMRGYLYPPATGDYKFWISSDDASVLFLSADSSALNKKAIAEVKEWTAVEVWDKFPEQESKAVTLQENKPYYIEVLFKEAAGGDHVSVAWEGPCIIQQVILGRYLSPYNSTDPDLGIDLALTNLKENDSILKSASVNAITSINGNKDAVSQVMYFRNNSFQIAASSAPYSFRVYTGKTGNYSVIARAIDTNYVVVDSDPVHYVVIDITTSIAEHTSDNIQLYPNPYDNKELIVTGISGNVVISFTTLSGQLMNQIQESATGVLKLNGLSLPEGIYLVKIETPEYSIIKKLIVQ